MPGAGLQAAGQVRSIAPYMVFPAINATVLITSPSAISEPVAVRNSFVTPWGRGADRPSRIFQAITGFSGLITADSYATAISLCGFFVYSYDKRKDYVLAAYSGSFQVPQAFNSERIFIPDEGIYNDIMETLGTVRWEPSANNSFGTATQIVFTLRLHIGLYGDYETDNQHCHECEREKRHMEYEDIVDL